MNIHSLRSPGLLIICIVLPLFAGVAGSFPTLSSIPTWYTVLIKPPLTPEPWVFGPVWTTLYILMGISLYLVVREGIRNNPARLGTMLFAGQLVVSVLWSFAFFGLRSPVSGLATILILIVLVLATMYYFYRVSRIAALLLVPYIAWICIATYLNYMIMILN